jgi:hypothetical protein
MIQMKKKKNTSIDHKTSVSVMSARIIEDLTWLFLARMADQD